MAAQPLPKRRAQWASVVPERSASAQAKLRSAGLAVLALEPDSPAPVARAEPGTVPERSRPVRPIALLRAGLPLPESSAGWPRTARLVLVAAPQPTGPPTGPMPIRSPAHSPRAQANTVLSFHFAANAFTPPGGETGPKNYKNAGIQKARGDRASAESRLGQEFVFVNDSGHSHLSIRAAIVEPYHSSLALDPDAFRQGNLSRKRQCELDR